MSEHGAPSLFDAQVEGWCRKAARIAPPRPPEGKPYAGLKICVMCMTPRSGSTHLGALMRANGLGDGQEHFRVSGDQMKKFVARQDVRTYEEYFREIVRTRRQGDTFLVKCDWWQFAPLYYFGMFDHYLKDASFIYLTRGSVLDQAVSRHIATRTGYFHSVNKDKADTTSDEVPFDRDEVGAHLSHLVEMQSQWEVFFAENRLSPLRLRYEEIDEDPRAVLSRLFAYLGQDEPEAFTVETPYERVRNARNERLAAAYAASSEAERRAIRERLTAEFASKTGAVRA